MGPMGNLQSAHDWPRPPATAHPGAHFSTRTLRYGFALAEKGHVARPCVRVYMVAKKDL